MVPNVLTLSMHLFEKVWLFMVKYIKEKVYSYERDGIFGILVIYIPQNEMSGYAPTIVMIL
jgi:NDP-sugar pyrophosphorylase family protein